MRYRYFVDFRHGISVFSLLFFFGLFVCLFVCFFFKVLRFLVHPNGRYLPYVGLYFPFFGKLLIVCEWPFVEVKSMEELSLGMPNGVRGLLRGRVIDV